MGEAHGQKQVLPQPRQGLNDLISQFHHGSYRDGPGLIFSENMSGQLESNKSTV
jgi:hypothetical protein